jgi:RNA polymerase sigma factor (sigma-70 family)
MYVIRRYDTGEDDVSECFIHVCGALSDHRFRRLQSFRCEGPARFKTWLMAVVANLCIDWRRKQHGRVRPLQCISRLPELDREVYRCIYLRGMSRAQCVDTLATRFPELTASTVSRINARLFAVLTPQQRWQLSIRAPATDGVGGGGPDDDEPAWQIATPGPGPEDQIAEAEEQQQLREALAQLPAAQRLLLRLRYEEGLTLVEVARLTGQPDPFTANRRVQAALDALAELLGGRQLRRERKNR